MKFSDKNRGLVNFPILFPKIEKKIGTNLNGNELLKKGGGGGGGGGGGFIRIQ